MSVVITDEESTIKITQGSVDFYLAKEGTSVNANGDYIYFNGYEIKNYRIKHSDVTSPVTANADALAETLEEYLDNVPGGSSSWGGITGTLSDQTDLQTALDAKSSKTATIDTKTGSYTLVLGDAGKIIEMNVGSANNLTVPPNASVAFPVGTEIIVAQYGAGQTTFVPDTGVTIRSDSGKLKLSAQYTAATLIKRGTNEWYLVGSLTS